MTAPAPKLQPCLHCQALTEARDQLCCSGCRFIYEGTWSEEDFTLSFNSPYDDPHVRNSYNISEDKHHTAYRLRVNGLQCSSCIHILEDLPQFLKSVRSARVNFATGEMHIEVQPEHSLGLILKFLEDMGYPSQPLKADESHSLQDRDEDRALLLRIAVAGACAGNIMLFSVAIYGGLIGATAYIFNFISLILFLPVLFYCAYPFYKGAWNSLRLGYLTVDVPLVAALWLGFGASLFNWWRGSGHIYFDSTAGFFFFILLSRWFLRISQKKWGRDFKLQGVLSETFYQVGDKLTLSSQIIKDDLVKIKNDQRVPMDGVLQSSSAVFDTSWMTGESVPRVLTKNMPVSAGFKVLSQEAVVLASGMSHDSLLAQSLRRVETTAMSQSVRLNVFDKAAKWLLLTVFALSFLMLFLGPWIFEITREHAFERALALLVVACPCALAFGGPLAYGMGVRRALDKGILLKSADVLDRVLESKDVVFDKTGTLTAGQLQLISQSPKSLPEWMKSVILQLESRSHHPVAYAFRNAWNSTVENTIHMKDIIEVAGKKVLGVYDGHVYTIQAQEAQHGALAVAFLQNENILATFEFEDVERTESPSILQKLTPAFRLSILSGDRQDRVDSFVKNIGVSFHSAIGGQRPIDKADWMKKNNPIIMLGDGLNDAEALSQAHVGIVVQGPLAQGLKLGSAYFLKPGIAPLLDMLTIAQQTKNLVFRNLTFALFYNVTAGMAALLGWVDPLVAAALMPLSSFLILLSTWRAAR